MPKTVLLADDSVTIQKVVGITFANEDVDLVTENNGDAALARAREITPDLILADVSMPGLNGYELCAAVRSEPRLAKIPIILLTGTFESFDAQKTAEVGADGHIAKPFEAQALVDLVRSTIERASRQPSAAPAAQPAPSVAPPLPSVSPPAPAAIADPGRTEIVSLNPEDEVLQPPELEVPSFEAASPTPMPALELPPAQPDPAAAAPEAAIDPGRTEVVSLSSQGDDLELPPAASQPAADHGFGDFDGEAHEGEATRVYDPAQAKALAGEAPLITPRAEAPLPPLPSVDPRPALASAPPSPIAPLATPDISPDLPPAAAMGDEPPASSGLQGPGADTDVDAVLYEETAFLDPRAASDEAPPALQASAELAAAIPSEAGQHPAVPPIDAVHGINDETAPDPGRQERAAVAAVAALDQLTGPPLARAEPPELELCDAIAEPEPVPAALAAEDPLHDDLEPLSMSQVELLGPPSQAAIEATPEPVVPEPAPPAPEPSGLELGAPIPDASQPPGSAEVRATLEKVAWDAFGPLSEQIVRDAVRKIEEIAWEVIPQLAEKLIREEIARLKKDD